MSYISYGAAVAFIKDGEIRFGVVAEVVERENKKGTTREIVIECGGAPAVVLDDGDDAVEIDPNYTIRHGDKILSLLPRCETYTLALKTAREIKNPPTPPSAAAREAGREEGLDAVRADADSSSPSPDEGAKDVQF